MLADKNVLATFGFTNNNIQLWDAVTGSCVLSHVGDDIQPVWVSNISLTGRLFSPTGKHLVFGEDGALKILSTDNGKTVADLSAELEKTLGNCPSGKDKDGAEKKKIEFMFGGWNYDGGMLAVVTKEKRVKIFDTNKILQTV